MHPLERSDDSSDIQMHLWRMLNDFTKENRVVAADIYCCIERERAFLRFIELPLAVKENLQDTIRFELDKYIPFASDDVYFDFQIVEEDKENGQMKILLAVMKKDVIEPLFKHADSGFGMFSGIELSSCALANFCAAQFGEGEKGPVGFLFAVDGISELNLLEDQKLVFSRSFSDGLSGEKLSKAWQAGLQRLLKTVVPTGEERAIPLLAAVGEADKEALESTISVEGFFMRDVDLDAVGLPSRELIPAYGAALKGLGGVPVEINLLPQGFRKKASRIGFYICGILMSLSLMMGLTWVAGTVYYQKEYLKKLEKAQMQLEVEVKRTKELEAEYSDLAERIEYLNALRRDDIQVLDVLTELTRVIPATAWLRRFNYSDRSVEIEGYADAASELIPLLEDSSLFKDVTFLSGITKSREGKETFRIGMKIG